MNRRAVSWIGCAVVGVVVAGGAWAADPLKQLGIGEEQAQEMVVGALENGYPPFGLATPFKALGPGARAAVVKEGLAWVKAYLGSADFAARYKELRDYAKPEPLKPQATVDEVLAQQRAEQQKQFDEGRKNAAQLPPEQRKEVEKALDEAVQTMAEMAKNPDIQAAMRQQVEAQLAGERQRFEEAMKNWEANYPADPRRLLARRMRAFLEQCSDVDYAAKLQPKDGKMVFVNPAYEAKDDTWKLCYRAGREAVGAAQEFARAWLAELPS